MAVEHAHANAHFDHNENIDHQGNANLATWAGLVALTFMTATFVATNVYLRGWDPAKFKLHDQYLTQLPYVTVLLSIVSAVLLFVAASFFKRDKWKAFNLTLALTTISFVVTTITQFRLMLWFANYSPQVGTIYAPTAAVEFLLDVLCVILLAVAGWYSGYGSKRKINQFFPVAMNVWLYTVISSVVILLVENVMTVGEFAAWCGQHLTP